MQYKHILYEVIAQFLFRVVQQALETQKAYTLRTYTHSIYSNNRARPQRYLSILTLVQAGTPLLRLIP